MCFGNQFWDESGFKPEVVLSSRVRKKRKGIAMIGKEAKPDIKGEKRSVWTSLLHQREQVDSSLEQTIVLLETLCWQGSGPLTLSVTGKKEA